MIDTNAQGKQSSVEAAGAERFRAFQNTTADDTAPLSLEDRVTALEAVVHEITPKHYSGGHVGAWLRRVGARLRKPR